MNASLSSRIFILLRWKLTRFFQKLTFFFSENDIVLSNEERDSIEGLLTELECLNALKDMEPDKSPGTDCLPSQFYRFFWSDVSKPLLEALNYGFEIGQLSISQ